ncbi:MAG: hypothetical protein NVS2B14_21840 [Chamaesiphon sp.]
MQLESLTNSDQSGIKRALILAVDDNEDNLLLLTQVLIALDCSFITANNGRTAVAMAQDHCPDLILLDIMLPDLNGIEVVEQLKQEVQTREIPIVAVTAMARIEDRERFLLAGCNEYVKKPYIIDELEAIIHRYIN